MPKYIYLHPDTHEEVEIVHSMNEVTNPSEELLKKIALPDGRIMRRKLVAPALIGFDNLGRSVLKKQEKEPSESCGKAATGITCDDCKSTTAA
jgi:hypothetical protein